jgi:hypothetical protein
LYLDKSAFREALDLPDEDDIYVLLVDGQGNVVWRTQGTMTTEAGASLDAFIVNRLRRNMAESTAENIPFNGEGRPRGYGLFQE